MKHYMDIENLREFDVEISQSITRSSNAQGFELGDEITISEKIDGANASIQYNEESQTWEACSRKQVLTPTKTLNGFYQFVDMLNTSEIPKNWIIFGEWTGTKNKIHYDENAKNKWFVFDIYNTQTTQYLPWKTVEDFCKKNHLDCAHMLYAGPFQGWNHVKLFCHSPAYGDIQEGVVCKNQTKLSDTTNRLPIYLKVVNKEFAESKIKRPKEVDLEKEKEKNDAAILAKQIVTTNRVEKMILKLRDEGLITDKIEPQDMKTLAKNLPSAIYQDCLKEEPEMVKAMGQYAGKAISSQTMQIAREIVLG